MNIDKTDIVGKEEELMQDIRDIIPDIVGIRLKVSNVVSLLKALGMEFHTAAEQVEETIEMLYNAEDAMGKAHQHILVSRATLMIQNNIKPAEK